MRPLQIKHERLKESKTLQKTFLVIHKLLSTFFSVFLFVVRLGSVVVMCEPVRTNQAFIKY